MAVTQVEDSKNLGDDEEVSRDLQGYLEVEEGMGMWEVFCEMIGQDLEWKIRLSQTHCRVARSPALPVSLAPAWLMIYQVVDQTCQDS